MEMDVETRGTRPEQRLPRPTLARYTRLMEKPKIGSTAAWIP
jgi:hypothetical protein